MASDMTSRTYGFKGFVAHGMPTLADVLAWLEHTVGLTPAARADLKSAVRTTCHVSPATACSCTGHDEPHHQ